MDFRRVNVEEEESTEDILQVKFPAPGAAEVQQVTGEVRAQASKGNTRGALQALLAQPPNQAFVDAAMEVLASTRTGDIAGIIKELGRVDGLVRYLFWGMERVGQGKVANGGVVLGWLEKVIEVEGNGSIVRCMTDRRYT